MAESQEGKVDLNQDEQFAKWERALQILRDVVRGIGIKDLTEYQDDKPLGRPWELYKRESPDDISLIFVHTGRLGDLCLEFYLLTDVTQREAAD